MGDRCRNMRLREWLIAQIDSGNYAGLSWENHEKTMFRIPWKHAAKQDYNRDEDAALFKAWAVYKGKFREGKDKADPSTWKTRLRCAMNKSTDFQEVPERSQLDISEPYKVYEIMDEGDKKTDPPDSPVPPAQPVYSSSQQHTPQRGPHALQSQFPMEVDGEWEKVTEKSSMQYQAAAPLKPGDNNRHVKGTFYTWTTPGTQAPGKAQTFQAALCPYPTQLQITELELYMREGCPCPRFHIDLCFGEEFPDPPQHKSKKLITAHIEPLFARELYRNAQRIGPGTQQSLQVPKTNTDDGTHSITKYLVQ